MILVTGGAGLVGKELVAQLLAKGKSVKAIYNKTSITGFNNINLQQVPCDVLDVAGLEEVMEGVTEVYHCAGVVAFTSKDAAKLFKVNVEGTANIVNAALHAGVRKLVHISSIAALGRPLNIKDLTDETMPWTEAANNSRYGHSKYLGELEVWRGIAEGLPAVIVNPSLILGAGNWDTGSTEIFKSVYKELPWYTEGVTGFVDVHDVATAMILLMESDIVSQRYVVSAENASFKDVFNSIAENFNKKPPNRKVTPLLAAIVWRLEYIKSKITGKVPLITRETAASALSVQYFNNKKLLKDLPDFNYRPLHETISNTCKALLQQKLNNQ